MLKIIWVVLSLILIGLIFLRTPQNQGLASFSTKSNLLGSPSSAEQLYNNASSYDDTQFSITSNSSCCAPLFELKNQVIKSLLSEGCHFPPAKYRYGIKNPSLE